MARRLVLDDVDEDFPEVWSLSASVDAVPLVFALNARLGWALRRFDDLARTRPDGRFYHALFRGGDGYRSTSLIWNAPHAAEWTAPANDGLFGVVDADPSSALLLSKPRGINAFLAFDPPLSSQEIVGLQQKLHGVPGLLGHNPRTSLSPSEHRIFVLDPLKESEL
ncbi:MAG: hypothetical protein ACO31C_03600 [Schleiferiaceae bacterium]